MAQRRDRGFCRADEVMNAKVGDEWDLGRGYSLRLMAQDDFDSLCRPLHNQIFLDTKPVLKCVGQERFSDAHQLLAFVPKLNVSLLFLKTLFQLNKWNRNELWIVS